MMIWGGLVPSLRLSLRLLLRTGAQGGAAFRFVVYGLVFIVRLSHVVYLGAAAFGALRLSDS